MTVQNIQERQQHVLQPHLDGLRAITVAIRVICEQLQRIDLSKDMVTVTTMDLPKHTPLTEDSAEVEGK